MTSGYMAVVFISIDLMPLFAPTLGNADPLFALVITPGARFTKQKYNNIYHKFLVKQSYNVF